LTQGVTCDEDVDDEAARAETARAGRIEAHLDDCRRCGMEAETYERIKSTLAAQRPDIPAESVDRLVEFGERLALGEESTRS